MNKLKVKIEKSGKTIEEIVEEKKWSKKRSKKKQKKEWKPREEPQLHRFLNMFLNTSSQKQAKQANISPQKSLPKPSNDW